MSWYEKFCFFHLGDNIGKFYREIISGNNFASIKWFLERNLRNYKNIEYFAAALGNLKVLKFLKENNPLRLMPYQQERVREQINKLRRLTRQENTTNEFISTTNIFYNLSLKELGQNLSKTWVAIINELTNYQDLDPAYRTINRIMNIFLREDRLIYVGITFAVLGLALYIIETTSKQI